MAIVGLGVAGDSWSDEYAAESYNYARNWAELLVSERGIDLGAPGDYTTDGDIRGNNGTAFNWAVTGATALDLLIESQDFGILDQFADGEVSHSVLMIGMTDFAPGGTKFTNIASGTWSQSQIDNELAFMALNLEGAITVLSGVALKGLVATIPDPTMTPQGRTLFDAAGRERVRAAVNAMNTKIKEVAAEKHTPVIDLAALSTALLGTPSNPATSRTIGGNVYQVAGGVSKTNLFIDGGVLPHTVFQAHIANTVIEGLNFAYNENIPRLTEQQSVTLAGQTYGGTDTFPLNYRNFVIVPPVTVYVDFGVTSSPNDPQNDDFTARISELATARGIAQLSPDVGGTPGELSQLKANILARLTTAFAGTAVNFTGVKPTDTRFEVIKVGRLSASVPGALTSALGQGTFDWLNSSETTSGFVFPDLITFSSTPGAAFDNINLATLSRADQLRYLENVLTFYIANESARGMGLSAADAYAYPEITNLAATGGVQYQDFMSGDPALGFNTSVFNGNPTFRFSPLGLAKLKQGRWVGNPQINTVAEVSTAHNTTATAQVLSPVIAGAGSLRVATVRGAAISVGSQVDLYRLSVSAGDKITAQTFATGVYGAPIDTIIRILAADGTTVLATNDNTLLGTNSINQVGTTTVDNDSLVLNHLVNTSGNIFIEVTAKTTATNTTGSYDLMVGNTVFNNFPWHNAAFPLNVNDSEDGLITAFDVLPIINELNDPQLIAPVTALLPTPTGAIAPPPYLDVDPDGILTAIDALIVINFLNDNPLGGGGNGGGEFVPFAAGEAVEEPVENSSERTSSGGEIYTALPAATSSSSPTLSRAVSNGGASAGQQNLLAWLLLNPVQSAGEATESTEYGSHEETDLALEEILNEAS